jgi:hypothetical protein
MEVQRIKLISQWERRQSNPSANGSSDNQTHLPMGAETKHIIRQKEFRQKTRQKLEFSSFNIILHLMGDQLPELIIQS